MGNPAVHRIVLMSSGSPYVLGSELVLSHDVSLEAEGSEQLTINASASPQRPGRVLSVAMGAVVELSRLRLTGGWVGESSSAASSHGVGGGAVCRS